MTTKWAGPCILLTRTSFRVITLSRNKGPKNEQMASSVKTMVSSVIDNHI